jgi:PadR family transcriptional regulator, regulatory protein PadR
MSERAAPMREPTYFVLASLLNGPLHGYGIIKRAGELSAGRVQLVTGALYTVLDRLIRAGYVRVVSSESLAGHVRRRYGLTETGRAALRGEADRMEQTTRVAGAGGRPATVGDILNVGGRVRLGGKARSECAALSTVRVKHQAAP